MNDAVAIDLETQNTSGKIDPYADPILLISVVFANRTEFIFERTNVPPWFVSLLSDSQTLKLFHNAAFDIQFLERNFNVKVRNVWCTLMMERLLTAGTGFPNDLQSVALRRLGKTLDKSIRDHFALGLMGDVEKEYCLNDSRVLLPIYEQQHKELNANGQMRAAEIENDLAPLIAEMELRGIGFDTDLWHTYLLQIETEKSKCEHEVWQQLGLTCSYDLISDEAVGGIPLSCRDRILDALKRNGIKLKDYSEEELQNYYYKHGSPVIKSILTWKQWEQASKWCYPKYINPKTGRIHADFNSLGADTGRFSCREPNLQQVWKPNRESGINFRHLFRAPQGRKIIGGDYGQIELRIGAEVTGEPMYLNAFNSGTDMHRQMAEMLLGRSLKDDSERNLGKVANFGSALYGGSHKVLMGSALDYGMQLAEKDAKKYIKTMRDNNTKIEAWGKEQLELLLQNHYLQTPIGHRRYFPAKDDPEDIYRETTARNTPIQSFAGGIMKDGFVRVARRLEKLGSDCGVILTVHDELDLEGPEDGAQEIEQNLAEGMIEAGNEWLHKVPTTVDTFVSDTWE
jgi:DNA polymerase I